jgi:hypothetical protein
LEVEEMIKALLCPYFSKNEDICGAGTTYINYNDAKEILDVCLKNFRICQRYIQLNQTISINISSSTTNLMGREYHGKSK